MWQVAAGQAGHDRRTTRAPWPQRGNRQVDRDPPRTNYLAWQGGTRRDLDVALPCGVTSLLWLVGHPAQAPPDDPQRYGRYGEEEAGIDQLDPAEPVAGLIVGEYVGDAVLTDTVPEIRGVQANCVGKAELLAGLIRISLPAH